MEDHKSLDMLSKIHKMMKDGEKMSGQITWHFVMILASLLLLLVGIPMLFANLDCFADPSSWLARFVFIAQLILVVVSAIYVWVVIHNRKLQMHSFIGVASELEVKIAQLNIMNGKKNQ